MHIEKSFANNIMYGSGSFVSGYPMSRFIASENQLNKLGGLSGGNLFSSGNSRFDGLVIPSGLVLMPENAKEISCGYKIHKDIDIIEDGIFNELMSNITHKSSSKQHTKRHQPNPTNRTRSRK